jgi:hypothetical protein
MLWGTVVLLLLLDWRRCHVTVLMRLGLVEMYLVDRQVIHRLLNVSYHTIVGVLHLFVGG